MDTASRLEKVRKLVFLVCLSMIISGPATAAPAPDQTLSKPEIQRTIGKLKDPEKRDELIRNLQALEKAQAKGNTRSATFPVDGEDLWPWIQRSFTELRDAVLNVNPRQVITSLLLTVATLIGAVAVRWLILRMLRTLYVRVVSHSKQERKAMRLPRPISRTVNVIVGVAGLGLVLESWGLKVSGLLKTDVGALVAEKLLAIGLIVLITVTLWHVAAILVERLLRVGLHDSGGRRERRLDTLVPLLRSVTQVVIAVLATLLVLSELGINIGPILAGAGILGLAVGFGAQTLVKDLITGVIILLEDTASVNDVIEVGGHAGMVEKMRIRTIQMRDLAGIVHVVPYSEVASIKNYTKNFSYYLFEIGVAYREDTDEVVKLLQALDEEMRQDDDFKDRILEPLEILGVDRFAASAVIIKARIRTKAQERWDVGREFKRRIKNRFDEAGIEIPFPHTTLYFGEPKQGEAPRLPLGLGKEEAELLETFASGGRG